MQLRVNAQLCVSVCVVRGCVSWVLSMCVTLSAEAAGLRRGVLLFGGVAELAME